MKSYIVIIKRTYVTELEIRAESKAEAIDDALNNYSQEIAIAEMEQWNNIKETVSAQILTE